LSTSPKLQRLADHVGTAVSLPRDAMAQEIKAALRDATATPDWLPPERRRASHENYARHLLYGDADGRFSILAIVWDHGQRSPIHGHYCWCAVGVYQGELTERHYREGLGEGLPVLVASAQRGPGTLSFEPAASGIHRIANESGAVAISLHVYGIARDSISTGVNRIYT
jgi:predicted metal-dependent enzyme (double-stranded beta helix superfamily)